MWLAPVILPLQEQKDLRGAKAPKDQVLHGDPEEPMRHHPAKQAKEVIRKGQEDAQLHGMDQKSFSHGRALPKQTA